MLYGFFVIEFQKILCHYLFKYFSFSSILGLQLDMCQTDLSGLHLISQFSRPEVGYSTIQLGPPFTVSQVSVCL